MPHIHISLFRDQPPRADVLGTGERDAFISLKVDEDVSIYIAGHGAECAANARELARTLFDAAENLDRLRVLAQIVADADAVKG